MEAAIQTLFRWMPFLFGIGFIAPLIAQIISACDVTPPFGLSPIVVGLLIGAPWGLQTVIRGRWL
ncbi:hypothetical protein D6851_14835 [Altericroceibacterium spongiae]|uniref:Uncharacterized protein n=1 Tax=Altericroceibacterium spongiae TaxID=2320269 RepID=A0A420ECH9_9SPHN|nr:hypothetical protein [Altericroceibacterium spongiae]RKF18419.1 hypothetical protein D6851_14835 [Altericroceibacterium spongiae]